MDIVKDIFDIEIDYETFESFLKTVEKHPVYITLDSRIRELLPLSSHLGIGHIINGNTIKFIKQINVKDLEKLDKGERMLLDSAIASIYKSAYNAGDTIVKFNNSEMDDTGGINNVMNILAQDFIYNFNVMLQLYRNKYFNIDDETFDEALNKVGSTVYADDVISIVIHFTIDSTQSDLVCGYIIGNDTIRYNLSFDIDGEVPEYRSEVIPNFILDKYTNDLNELSPFAWMAYIESCEDFPIYPKLVKCKDVKKSKDLLTELLKNKYIKS